MYVCLESFKFNNNNNKYLYSALQYVTQNAVAQKKYNINKNRKKIAFEEKKITLCEK